MSLERQASHAYEVGYLPKKRYVDYLLNEIKENKIHTLYIYAPFTRLNNDTWRKEFNDALVENTAIVNYNIEDEHYRYDRVRQDWSFLEHIVERNRKIQDLVRETKKMIENNQSKKE